MEGMEEDKEVVHLPKNNFQLSYDIAANCEHDFKLAIYIYIHWKPPEATGAYHELQGQIQTQVDVAIFGTRACTNLTKSAPVRSNGKTALTEFQG